VSDLESLRRFRRIMGADDEVAEAEDMEGLLLALDEDAEDEEGEEEALQTA